MLTVEKPANKVDEAFKVKKDMGRDMGLEEAKTDGKSIWYMMYYKFCKKTHVLTYYDRQDIQEPLAPKDQE